MHVMEHGVKTENMTQTWRHVGLAIILSVCGQHNRTGMVKPFQISLKVTG